MVWRWLLTGAVMIVVGLSGASMSAAQGFGQPDAPAAPVPPPPPPPPESPKTEAKEWFYAVGQEVRGPMTLDELMGVYRRGDLTADTRVYVARNGWRPAKDHPEVAALLATGPQVEAPPVAPPPPPPPPEPQAGSGDSQADLDRRAQAYLVGTWRTESRSVMNGTEMFNTIDLYFAPGGEVSGTVTTRMPGSGPGYSTGVTGTYRLQAQGNTKFLLIMRYEMTAGMQPTGSTSSQIMQVVDRDTMMDQATGQKSVRLK